MATRLLYRASIAGQNSMRNGYGRCSNGFSCPSADVNGIFLGGRRAAPAATHIRDYEAAHMNGGNCITLSMALGFDMPHIVLSIADDVIE